MLMVRFAYALLVVATLTWSQCSWCQGADTRAAVEFARDVLPILLENCYQCHGPDEQARQADLRLDTRLGALAVLDGERPVIAPGDPQRSELFRRVAAADADQRMPPPEAGQLTAAQVDTIRQWIEQGAPWRPHWALVRPERPALPEVPQQLSHPIDRFVAARLHEQGLSLSPPADRHTLIRRLSLDLTGLPPTPEQADAFARDNSPDAYQRLVDRLLASPRYGERMAIQWLDAARYADTHGYLFDTERFMWRWRDWVIEALNANMPFDQFTIEQLAGDLLPDATHQQQLATGFHRNHLINNEAGAIPAEYLVENIVDRVNTTATVWMGLTVGCCQCHDHKYDPFTQREYYRLYAFFNNVPETGLDGLNSNAKPLMPAPTPGIREELAAVQQQRQQAAKRLEQLAEQIAAAQSDWEQSLATAAAPQPLPDLAAHWPLDNSAADMVRPEQPAAFEAAPESYSEGLLGAAAELDGLAYLNGGDRFDLQAQDALTLTAWVRPTTKTGRLTVLSRMRDAKGLFRGYAVQLINGLPALFLVHEFPENLMQVQGKTALEPDQWHHLAVTYDGTGKAAGAKLYVNGEPQATGVVIDKLSGPVATDEPFWIGNGHPAAKFKGRIDEVRVYRCALTAEQVEQLPGLSMPSLLAIDVKDRTAELQRRIREFYLTNHAPPQWRNPHRAVAELSDKLKELNREVPTVMVMQERQEPRETRVLRRGAFDQPGDVVTAGTPDVLPPLPSDWPRNRLGLARWLVDPQHPLTARVTVNRIWQLHFGQGLVKTSEDFGVQGERPSHPQLLDWLAVELVDSGWDIKGLQRLIVTSAAYRQTSRVTPQLLRLDAENRLLARGPRHRLPAELIRDQALAASGLLSGVIGGPSVKPYQPPGLWREVAFDLSGANLTAQVYQQDSGESLYRRSLYTFWKRTAPPPTLQLLDAPDRERCQVRREQTNTPLQALALMNDPTFVEASRKLAERMMREGGPEPAKRIARGFRLAVGRPPGEDELQTLVRLLESQLARFAQQAELAEQLLSVGQSPRDESLEARQLAAYTIVANVILNLDETITKG